MGIHVIDFWAFLNPVEEKHSSLWHTSIWKFHRTISHNTHLLFLTDTESLRYKRHSGDVKKKQKHSSFFRVDNSVVKNIRKKNTVQEYRHKLKNNTWVSVDFEYPNNSREWDNLWLGMKVCLQIVWKDPWAWSTNERGERGWQVRRKQGKKGESGGRE